MKYLIASIIGAFIAIIFVGKHISGFYGDLAVAICGAVLANVFVYKIMK